MSKGDEFIAIHDLVWYVSEGDVHDRPYAAVNTVISIIQSGIGSGVTIPTDIQCVHLPNRS